MKKEEITKSALKILAGITAREIEKNTSVWPPRCGFFYISRKDLFRKRKCKLGENCKEKGKRNEQEY